MDLNRGHPPARIELRIDELVFDGVHGIGREHAALIADAVTGELARLLEEQPPSGLADAHDDRGFDALCGQRLLPVPRSPGHFGTELARAVHARLGALPVTHSADPEPPRPVPASERGRGR